MKIFKKNHSIDNIPQTQKLLNKIIDYYQKTFFEDKKALDFLAQHEGITEKSAFTKLRIGYSNGSLLSTIPEDGQITAQLKQLGILDLTTGKEKFLDCVIFPVFDEQGRCIDIYGRRISSRYPVHIYLNGQNKPLNLKEHFKKEEQKQEEVQDAVQRDLEGEQVQALKDGLFIRYGDRKYLIRGIESSGRNRLKVNLKAVNEKRFHIDCFDLYISKQRKAFAKETAILFHSEPQVTEEDLNKIIENTEKYIEGKKENTNQPYIIPDQEKEEALKFLKSPNLIDQILKDFETIGCAGEETNKLIGYLVAVSRKLDDPLSLLILSRSAAGKSLLQDSILELVPPEDKVKYTRVTGQALFYKGENSLQHKIIAIEEEEGAQAAAYSIRTMQSSKLLIIAAAATDPLTGQLKTQENHVRGPISVLLTTTREDMDYETLTRFILSSVDESKEQTELIHRLQRARDTVEGLLSDNDKEAVIRKHHNAQRLLRNLKVVNPYAKHLTFVSERLRARRDHKKYLSLIKAITYLYQYQRPIKTVEHKGKTINYIETTLDDISFANRLANEVLGRSLDELSPPSRKLLKLVNNMVKLQAEKQATLPHKVKFTRRDIREYTKWSDYQVSIHLKQLVDLEYILALFGRNGSRFTYELIYDGQGEDGSKFLVGLVDLKTLRQKVQTSRPKT